jgi:leader peptidase (prepilin peptidase)/N-methyltransferase
MIRILGTVFAGLFGLAFGSFLNVCLSRWPEGESVVHPHSHCRNCDHTLSWWENIPLVSWIALRGRCRNCYDLIGWRYPMVELAVAALWGSVAWSFPVNVLDPSLPRVALYDSLLTSLGLLVFYWLLIALAVLDAEYLWLPNRLTLPGVAAGFLISVFSFIVAVKLDSIGRSPLHPGFQYMRGELWDVAWSRFIAIFIAAVLILLIRWLYKLVRHQEGIGLGDAKLMAMLAAWLGLPGALLAFAMALLIGCFAALILLFFPSTRQDSTRWAGNKLPLGTFLCIGGIVSSLWGQPMINAYLRWSGL